MKRLVLAIAAGGIALLSPSTGAAQQGAAQPPVDPLSAQAIVNFARCAAHQTPQGAERVLGFAVDSLEFDEALRRFARGHERCITSGALRFGGILLAGGLAEALVERRMAGRNLASLVVNDPNRPPLASRNEMEFVGICLTRRDPNGAAALMATDPASDEERAAIGALAQHMPSCVEAGMTMRLNRPAFRAVVALGAYRLAQHNASPLSATEIERRVIGRQDQFGEAAE